MSALCRSLSRTQKRGKRKATFNKRVRAETDALSDPVRVTVGGATFTSFQVGKINLKASELIRKGTELPDGITPDTNFDLPICNGHLAVGEASIVIDPCDYEELIQYERRPEGYVAPPSLLSQLSGRGVKAEDVTHVVITHFHMDHCIGSTMKTSEGTYVPTFPRARYYLGAADWNSPMLQEDLKSTPMAMNSLGVLGRSKVLTLVDRPMQVVPDVMIVPMPGESPGHQGVRMTSQGATLWCIGDLFHDAMDVADPRIMADWNDPESNIRSRNAFLAEAARDDCVVFSGHMSLGRILRTLAGYEWKELRAPS